jgi:two-component system sensor histidine kinase VicK
MMLPPQAGWELLESLSSGVVATDLEGRVTYVNRALQVRLQVERERWVGRPVGELAAHLSALLAEGSHRPLQLPAELKQRASTELAFKEGAGLFHLREDAAPLRDAAGRVTGRVFTYHDITQEKTVDRMKTEFIAVASHELRTPMTSIKGSIDLVLSGFAGEISQETQELLEIAQKSCDRLIRLINNILDLAKIESRQVTFELVPLDITDVAQRAIRSVQAVAAQSKVTLQLKRAGELPAIRADKDRLEQVITNLLANAIKFSPPEQEVAVELETVESSVVCRVRDHGCGIAEHDLEKVFGRFQQVGDHRRKGGTGLGLAIARALVEEHQGTMWVESRLGEGASFIFRIPAAQD